MVEKIKRNVDRLLLVSKMKKSSSLTKYIGNFFFTVKTKISQSTSVFIFSTISQIIKKQNFMYFEYKRVETGLNCSHELATFFKYHMPLRSWINRTA